MVSDLNVHLYEDSSVLDQNCMAGMTTLRLSQVYCWMSLSATLKLSTLNDIPDAAAETSEQKAGRFFLL